MNSAADCLLTTGSLHKRPAIQMTSADKQEEKNTFFRIIDLWFERSRQRRELRELIESPEATFMDIGISRYDVLHEGRKPFWRE